MINTSHGKSVGKYHMVIRDMANIKFFTASKFIASKVGMDITLTPKGPFTYYVTQLGWVGG